MKLSIHNRTINSALAGAVVGAFILLFIPEDIIGSIVQYRVAIGLVLASFIGMIVFAERAVSKEEVWLWAAGIAIAVRTLIAIFRNETLDPRGLLTEPCEFLCLLAGVRTAQSLSVRLGVWLLVLLLASATTLIAFNIFAIETGRLSVVYSGGRLVVASAYQSVNVLLIVLPVVMLFGIQKRSAVVSGFVAAGVVCALFYTAMSATRSLLLLTAVSFVLGALVSLRSKRALLYGMAAIGICAVAFNTNAYKRNSHLSDFELLKERFDQTALRDESRMQEASDLVDSLGTSALWGKGFGSVMTSAIAEEAMMKYATIPHLGILTLLYKGGLLVFICIVVYPGLMAARGLFVYRNPLRKAAAASLIVAYFLSSTSGGWNLTVLWLMGFLFMLMRTPELAWSDSAFAVTHQRRAGGTPRALADHRRGIFAKARRFASYHGPTP
jgi:hypothetical protein